MMSASTNQYIRLRNLRPDTQDATPNNVDQEDHHYVFPENRGHSRRFLAGIRPRTLVLATSLAFNCYLLLKILVAGGQYGRLLTYSPAFVAVEHKRVVFSSGFGIERSPFQGEPSPENDGLWAGLYDFGITRISAHEARPMDNKTLPIPDADGGYVVQLAVFHQLHCLNLLRKGIYGAVDMSDADDLVGIEHLDHCVDMLRQSIMCSSDVTPITFARTSLHSSMKVVAEVVHTCRDFPKIQQWAWNKRVRTELDKDTLVTDDPLGWGTYTYEP